MAKTKGIFMGSTYKSTIKKPWKYFEKFTINNNFNKRYFSLDKKTIKGWGDRSGLANDVSWGIGVLIRTIESIKLLYWTFPKFF